MKFLGKKGNNGVGAAAGDRRSSASTPNKGLIWAAWLLSTAGFAILLGGVASMQSVSISWGQCW